MPEEIVNIEISKISNFKNHPFKVLDDDKMDDLVENVKQKEIFFPAIVRAKEDGTYEMISGHRRKRALERAGIDSMPCIIKKLSDDEATILMVDTNIYQREELLPSEKAKAYKMKMDAIKHQGERTDLNNSDRIADMLKVIQLFEEKSEPNNKVSTSAPMEPKSNRTNEIVANESSESVSQIKRYIRLNELIPEILDMVDKKKIAFRPAVEISYLNDENQYVLLNVMNRYDCTPSLGQAIYLKKLQKENKLESDRIEEIMSEEKPNQVEKVKIDARRFEKVFPKNIITNKQKEDFLFMCAEEHNKRIRNKELSR